MHPNVLFVGLLFLALGCSTAVFFGVRPALVAGLGWIVVVLFFWLILGWSGL